MTRVAWHCWRSIPAQMAQLNLPGAPLPAPTLPTAQLSVSPLLPAPQETSCSPDHQRGPSDRSLLVHWSALFEWWHENFSLICTIILPSSPPPIPTPSHQYPPSLPPSSFPAASPFSPWNFPAAAELARQSGVLEKYIFGLICHA